MINLQTHQIDIQYMHIPNNYHLCFLFLNGLPVYSRKQDEVTVLEDTIRQRSEQQKKAGVEMDATCHICLKTKFADGVGHICHYCNIRCCARCGGKVTLRSNKVSRTQKMLVCARRLPLIRHPTLLYIYKYKQANIHTQT